MSYEFSDYQVSWTKKSLEVHDYLVTILTYSLLYVLTVVFTLSEQTVLLDSQI